MLVSSYGFAKEIPRHLHPCLRLPSLSPSSQAFVLRVLPNVALLIAVILGVKRSLSKLCELANSWHIYLIAIVEASYCAAPFAFFFMEIARKATVFCPRRPARRQDIAYPEALATINVGKTHASPTSVPSVTTIRNVGTELEKPSQVVMGFSETSETVRMFDESDGKGSQWWVLMPVEGKQDKYYIVAAIAGKQMYLADSRNSKNRVILKEADDDASFRLWWTVTRTSHDGWYSIQDERGWYLSVPGIGSYVDVHHTDDKTGHQHWLLPEWSPVGYTCKFDLDYANNDLGPEVPHQDIFSDQTCADKCDFTAKCQGFVMVPSNPYGGTPGCYLKFKMGNVRSMPGWKSCKSDATLFF